MQRGKLTAWPLALTRQGNNFKRRRVPAAARFISGFTGLGWLGFALGVPKYKEKRGCIIETFDQSRELKEKETF